MAIGVYYTTLMHDKEGFQTTDLQKGIEIVKEEDHTENLDKENLHTFTSFTNGISEFSSDLYQVIMLFINKGLIFKATDFV